MLGRCCGPSRREVAIGNNGILVIDDDREVQDAVRQVLELEGYSITCASDGREAFDRLSFGGLPALILLDLQMKGMSGWEFRRLQLLDPSVSSIPVILVSAEERLSGHVSDLSAMGFLRKPFSASELLQTVKGVS